MSSAGTGAGLLVFGLLLGMKHALEADHVAAVAALVTRSRSLRHSLWQGVAWGTGHALTLLVFGGIVLAAHASVPARLAHALEFVVGAMLVALGVDVLRRLARSRVHFHAHRHDDGVVHVHAHSHADDGAPHDARHHRHVHPEGFPLRALAVGMTHGMAGTAAVLLLTAGEAGSSGLGLAHIASFAAGSILGMAALSVAIALPLRWSAARLGPFQHTLRAAVAVATIALGASLMLEIAA